MWWAWEMSWIAVTHLGAKQMNTSAKVPWASNVFEAFVAGAWIVYWTDDTLYWFAKPTVHLDATPGTRRLHCANGPALESDAEDLYFWHGVFIPAFVVEHPETITVQQIEAEQNIEVRRVMIERYGQARYILDSGAKPVQSDDYGTLYRKEIPGDETMVFVKVANSTPEADRSYRDYFLRVPPEMRTAREAVAWSFYQKENDYAPSMET